MLMNIRLDVFLLSNDDHLELEDDDFDVDFDVISPLSFKVVMMCRMAW